MCTLEAGAWILRLYWLANPKNDCKLVQLARVGNSDTAFVIEESIRYPADDSWNPAKVTWV